MVHSYRRVVGLLSASLVLVAFSCSSAEEGETADAAVRLVEESVAGSVDERRAVELVEMLAVEVHDHPGQDALPSDLRPAAAELILPHLDAINNALREREEPIAAQGPWSWDLDPGEGDAVQAQVNSLLAELGKDIVAIELILDAQLAYVLDATEEYFATPDRELAARLDDVLQLLSSYADVVIALLQGAESDSATVAHVDAVYRGLNAQAEAAGALLGVPPDLSLSETVDEIVTEHGDTPMGQLENRTQDELRGVLQIAGRLSSREFTSAVIYRGLPLTDPEHDELLGNLPQRLLDLKEEDAPWVTADQDAWYRYLDDNPVLESHIGRITQIYRWGI